MLSRASVAVNMSQSVPMSSPQTPQALPPVRGGAWRPMLALAVAAFFSLAWTADGAAASAAQRRAPAPAAQSADDAFLAARDAFRAGDRERLAALAARLNDHPLAVWVEYWQTSLKLRSEEPARTDAAAQQFFARHPDSYLADRLRMDWLLALGARRDFVRFAAEHPALVWQHDDQQVRCYAALIRYRAEPSPGVPAASAAGKAAASERAREARQLLSGTRDSGGEGCMALTDALLADRHITPWDRMRALVENGQFANARRMAALLPRKDAAEAAQAIDKPAQFLSVHARRLSSLERELAIVAISRLARDDPADAARHAAELNLHFTPEQRGLVWGRVGHMGATRLLPEALDWYRLGGEHVGNGPDAARAGEVLEWQMRAALRGTAAGPDWAMVRSTYRRMNAELQRDAAWVYWNARALAAAGQREQAQALYRGIAGQFSFYGKLAAEELGEPIVIPPRAAAPAAAEVERHASNAGLARALKLIDLGLRVEANREWGWQLRNRSDTELLAIAEFARSRNTLDRMIATSDRTRELFDFTQRFPAPHRADLTRHAQAVGVDETWVYGLIRQESRFIQDARSSVGAQGLMQIMPATARYVAKRVGMSDFAPGRINELDVNLRLGTSYLKMVLDDLDGHPALASAAYNAGPGRPRAWRASLPRAVEGAIFAETIPFNETRDYVKKVMSNTVYYAALFDNKAQSLKTRLGTVAPKSAGKTELP
jgi:soluble lytic murein transglycosylase